MKVASSTFKGQLPTRCLQRGFGSGQPSSAAAAVPPGQGRMGAWWQPGINAHSQQPAVLVGWILTTSLAPELPSEKRSGARQRWDGTGCPGERAWCHRNLI